MVVVEYGINEMKNLTGFDKQRITNGLTEIGAPCEEHDERLVVELTPNRPDWFFAEGLARALKSYYKNIIPSYKAEKSGYKVIVDRSVEKIRPYTICAVVKGLSLNTEKIEGLIQAQEKLMATIGRKTKKFGMGFFDLSKLAFPIHYTTLKPDEIFYKPLNYPRAANAIEILEKHPKGIEHGYMISKFDRYPVFHDANRKIMVLIPIVNSEEVGRIDESTHDVFIEVTGIDQNIIARALKIVACSLIDMGGKAYSVEMNYPGKKFQSLDLRETKEKLDIGFTNRILGTKFGKKEIVALLKRMGFETVGEHVLVPPYRLDIMHFIDIVEDIAIAYGFNNFETSLPGFFTQGQLAADGYEKAGAVMRSMGFWELKNFILTNKEKVEMVGNMELKEITNPATAEFTVLRPSLALSMLETFALNKNRALPQKLYEIGDVYDKGKLQKRLAFGLMGDGIEFAEFRGYIQVAFEEFGIEFEIKKTQNELFESKISGLVLSKQKQLGVCGKISPDLLKKFNINSIVYFAEFSVF